MKKRIIRTSWNKIKPSQIDFKNRYVTYLIKNGKIKVKRAKINMSAKLGCSKEALENIQKIYDRTK